MSTLTERLRALTAELRSSVAEVQVAAADARESMRAAREVDVTGTEEYRRLERESAEAFRSGRSGRAAQDLQEKVDRGELTWREIREGGVDPEATRLYLENQSAFLDEVSRIKQELDEREEDDDRQDAGRFDPDDDDPDDDGPSILKKRR